MAQQNLAANKKHRSEEGNSGFQNSTQ